MRYKQYSNLVWDYKLQFSNQFKSYKQIRNIKMADVIRVKAKKTYEWDQDNKYLFIKVPMPGHTTIKNLEIYLSDLILRITSKQKKSAQTLDLVKQVDYLSAQNKFVLIDGVVNATIKKKNAGEKWENLLVEDISLAELKQRRKQSQARYQLNIKQIQQNKEKLKTQHDRMATKELMRFQQQQRKKLEKKKQQQKQAALYEVFKDINDKTGKIQYQEQKWNQKGAKDLQRLQRQQEAERNRQKEQRKRQQQQKYLKQLNNKAQTKPIKTTKNTMFTQQDVQHFDELRNNVQSQVQQIPVRKQAKVNVKFTQKLYPNVATRDYHYAEPPMPKGSMPMPPPRQGDLESRNPLWLKDRGDAFMKHKNYSAALDAYNQAIRIDPTQRKILMNRSLTNMKLFNLDAAIHDCETILLQMQKQVVNNQQNKDESLLDLIKIKVRKGLCLAWKGKLSQAKQILTQQLNIVQIPQIKQQIQQALTQIQNRQQSHTTKTKGDELVKRQQYEQGLAYYNKSIQLDNNEYSLSNKCLCLNKLNKYEQSISTSNEGIKIIQQFISQSNNNIVKNNPQYIGILMKLLYRKSNAQQQLKMMKQAQSTLRKALNINPQDRDIKSALNLLKNKQAMSQYIRLKQVASVQLTKNNNAQQALKLYIKCIKLLQNQQNISQYLSILQNQCVCYLKLQQYDNIISVCIRILNIVNNLKNKIVEFGDKKSNTNLTKPMLNKIGIRTLMRRANAYLKLGQVYNAKSDLQKAVQLDPSDSTVTNQLQKLKQSIGAP